MARALLYPHADPTYFAYCQEIVLAVPLRKALVRVSIDAGQHGTAYGLLHTLLQGRPDDVECLDLLAELYALHGARYEASGLAHLARHVAKQRAEQPLKASPALRAALARPAPADAVAERTHAEWLKVAGHYVNTRQVSHAQVALRAALAHQPGSREARILLARLEQLQGGPNFVLDTLQTACDLPPDHAEAFARRGLVLLSAKEVGPARAHIDRALTADPDLPLARAADVALQWTHDPQGGRAASEALLGEFPADPDVAEVLHRCYVDAGDPAGAADFLDRHLRAAPQSLVWTDRLILDMNAGRLDALAEGLARAPNPRGGEPNMLAATLRAHLLSRRSDSPELRDLADWIVEHNALNPMILMLVANVARAVNDEGRLLGVLKRMFRLAKPEERLDMLQILRLFGLREETLSEAAAWAAEEIARDPSCTAGYVLAVCVAVARRRPDDALQFARRIQEIPDALPGELRLAREVVAQAPGGGPR